MSKRVRIHRRSMTRSIARAVSPALVACAPEEAPGGEFSAYAGDRWIGGVEELRAIPAAAIAELRYVPSTEGMRCIGDLTIGAMLLVIRRD